MLRPHRCSLHTHMSRHRRRRMQAHAPFALPDQPALAAFGSLVPATGASRSGDRTRLATRRSRSLRYPFTFATTQSRRGSPSSPVGRRSRRGFRFTVAERFSGLAAGTIELRRQGTATWPGLPTRVDRNRLGHAHRRLSVSARRLSAPLVARDRAGNESSTTARTDGSQMLIRLPLRFETRMTAGSRPESGDPQARTAWRTKENRTPPREEARSDCEASARATCTDQRTPDQPRRTADCRHDGVRLLPLAY